MDEHQNGNRRQRVPGGFFIAVLQERRVFQELDRSARDDRRARVARIERVSQLAYKFLLVFPLPHVLLRIDLQQKQIAGFAYETMPQRGRQIFRPQRATIVLVLERVERFPDVTEQRLLERGQFLCCLLWTAEHALPELFDGRAQRPEIGKQFRLLHLAAAGILLFDLVHRQSDVTV